MDVRDLDVRDVEQRGAFSLRPTVHTEFRLTNAVLLLLRNVINV